MNCKSKSLGKLFKRGRSNWDVFLDLTPVFLPDSWMKFPVMEKLSQHKGESHIKDGGGR